MSSFDLKYKSYGDKSILVEWPSIIDDQILKNILLFKSNLDHKYKDSKTYIKTSYNSLLITYPKEIKKSNKVLELKNIYKKIGISSEEEFKEYLKKKDLDFRDIYQKIKVIFLFRS